MNMYMEVYGSVIICVYVINKKDMHITNKNNAE